MQGFILISFCLVCCLPGLIATNLQVIRQWAELQFNFPSEDAKKAAIEKGFYVRGNSVPIDVDVIHRKGQSSRIFVTNPRFNVGQPITLGIVNENGTINPYPDYSWHDNQFSNCNGISSVFRIAIDECRRLWVLDSGNINGKQVCPPKLLAFDLKTDKVIFKHMFDKTVYECTSLFVTPVVDVRKKNSSNCSGTYVYVADVGGFAIVVVDVDRNRSWKISHRLFYPFPSRGTYTINGESYDEMDGVLGMALSPMRRGQDRDLYFHALASTTENIVSTKVLQNDSFIQNPTAESSLIKVFPKERTNQSAAEAMDRDGIMYFGLMDPPSIWCWNSFTEFSSSNFHLVGLNKETLQFASGVKVVNNLKGEQELWVLTSSYQKSMTGTLNSNTINFRIHVGNITQILKKSPCTYRSPIMPAVS